MFLTEKLTEEVNEDYMEYCFEPRMDGGISLSSSFLILVCKASSPASVASC